MLTTENRVEQDQTEQTAAAEREPRAEDAAGTPEAVPERASEPAPDPLEAAESKARAAEARAAEAHDRYLRAQAELENVRKRAARELADGLRYANEQLVRELLPAVDNLERALAAASDETGAAAGLRAGISLTQGQLLGVLKRYGVTPVEALGRPFDPTVHEAVQQVESDQPAGTVVAEYQRGYLLNGRLVRPAMVAVAAPRAGGGGAS